MWEYFALDQDRGAGNVWKDAENTDNEDDKEKEVGEKSTGGTKIAVYRDDISGEVEWKYRADPGKEAQWEESILEFLADLQDHVGDDGITELDIRTEHRRMGKIFRGHPNYRGNGMWNDWAVFDWGKSHGQLPAEIWCFVDFSLEDDYWTSHYAECDLESGVYAVVESTIHCPDDDDKSELFTPFVKQAKLLAEDGSIAERQFYLADVESIVEVACVIPDIGSDNKCRYFQVTPREEWPIWFQQWLERPHRIDEEGMSDADD